MEFLSSVLWLNVRFYSYIHIVLNQKLRLHGENAGHAYGVYIVMIFTLSSIKRDVRVFHI